MNSNKGLPILQGFSHRWFCFPINFGVDAFICRKQTFIDIFSAKKTPNTNLQYLTIIHDSFSKNDKLFFDKIIYYQTEQKRN